MALAALIVAIIALLVAAASGYYTRSQAVAAKGSLAIETARHRDELAPRFESFITSDGQGLVLQLRLLPDQRPMAGIKAKIVEAIGVKFDTSRRTSNGNLPTSWHTAKWDGIVAPGSQVTWPIVISRPGNSDEAALEVSDQANTTRGAVIIVHIPPDPTKTIW